MKVSLRKAASILASLSEEFKEINIVHSISINEFQDPEATILAAKGEFDSAVARKMLLLLDIYKIRGAVAEGNHVSGVNAILTSIAFAEKNLEVLKSMICVERKTAAELAGSIAKMKSDTSSSPYSRTTVDTTIATKESLLEWNAGIKEIKAEVQELKDKLLHLNVTTMVEIGDLG